MNVRSKEVVLFSFQSRFANKGKLYYALGTSQEKYDVSLCSVSVNGYLNPVVCFVMSPYSYKFTLDKLYSMRASVTLRVESYKKWLCDVQEILENKTNKKRGQKWQKISTAKPFCPKFSPQHPLFRRFAHFTCGLPFQ